MHDAHILRDVFNPVSYEAKETTEEPLAIISYGSFLYNRSLDEPLTNYSSAEEFAKKTHDFIIVTENFEGTIENLARKLGWDLSTKDKQKKIQEKSPDSPSYYHLFSDEEFKLYLSDNAESINPFIKLGIISKEGFLDAMNPQGKSNIYLASRLSKANNTVYLNPNFKDIYSQKTIDAQKFMSELSMCSLPQEFSGEEFLRQYLKSSYTAEIYRSLVEKNKHLKILESEFFDIEKNKLVPMRNKLSESLEDIVSFQTDHIPEEETICLNQEFTERKFKNTHGKNKIQRFMMYVPYNIANFTITLKNIKTNKACKAKSNFQYIKDKLSKKNQQKT